MKPRDPNTPESIAEIRTIVRAVADTASIPASTIIARPRKPRKALTHQVSRLRGIVGMRMLEAGFHLLDVAEIFGQSENATFFQVKMARRRSQPNQ